MIRPSSLPFLAACPCWESAPETGEQDKNEGTTRHHALAHALAGDDTELLSLDCDEAEKVQWALDYITVHSPDNFPMKIEQKISALNDDFEIITAGTPDVTCGPKLFDLKWRYRNYREQMAAYALAMMQSDDWPAVEYHLLFADRKHAEVSTLTMEEATTIVTNVINAANDAHSQPIACDYCGWCAKRLTCPALTSNVEVIASARHVADKQKFAIWLAAGAHSSALTDPAVSGMVLTIARQISEWCEAAEHHCKELAIKQGIIPVGYKLQSRQGNRFISSVTDAFARAGLPQDEFLKLCEIKLTTLVEKYGETNGMKKAQAERTVEEKMGEIIQRKSPSMSLVKEKNK